MLDWKAVADLQPISVQPFIHFPVLSLKTLSPLKSTSNWDLNLNHVNLLTLGTKWTFDEWLSSSFAVENFETKLWNKTFLDYERSFED